MTLPIQDRIVLASLLLATLALQGCTEGCDHFQLDTTGTSSSSSSSTSTSSTTDPVTSSSSTTTGVNTSTTTDPTEASTTQITTSTTGPVCGDGVVEGSEACDDGTNDGSYGGCALDCSSLGPHCGDGAVNGPEPCDDGNPIDDDSCSNNCVAAACGDGILNAPDGTQEECDPMDRLTSNSCTPECTISRIAFATSTIQKGDLGGLTGADKHCQNLANSAKLSTADAPLEFMAWLSDSTSSPLSRFPPRVTSARGPFRRTDGMTIANNWMDLIDGMLANPINHDEKNATQSTTVWTNTLPNGSIASSNTCDNWTATSGNSNIGNSNATDKNWTDSVNNLCIGQVALYCFQVTP